MLAINFNMNRNRKKGTQSFSENIKFWEHKGNGKKVVFFCWCDSKFNLIKFLYNCKFYRFSQVSFGSLILFKYLHLNSSFWARILNKRMEKIKGNEKSFYKVLCDQTGETL